MRSRLNFFAACTLGAVLVVGGCKSNPSAPPAAAGKSNPDGSITNPDGSVTYPKGTGPAQAAAGVKNPDGSVTNPDGSVTYPAGTGPQAAPVAPPVAAAPAAAPAVTASEPAREAAPAAPRVRTVPSGTKVAVTLTETLAASKNNVGDGFTGVLAEPVVTAGGGTVFARGTRVAGEVVAAKGRGRFKGAGDLGIQLTSIGGMRVSTSEYEKVAAGKGKRTAVLAGGGAGLGAIIGGLAGGGKGALIGGLAGGGAGTAGAAYTGNKDVVIPSETVITFRTTAPMTVK